MKSILQQIAEKITQQENAEAEATISQTTSKVSRSSSTSDLKITDLRVAQINIIE